MNKNSFNSFLKGRVFSEIIIVVGIIALLCAIVAPSLLKIKINANEQAAVSAAKSIYLAAREFASLNNGSYPGNLAVLWNLNYPVTVTTGGYYFHYVLLKNPDAGYWISIQPVTSNSGINFYYIDEQGIVCKGQKAAIGHAPLDSACPVDFTPLQ